MSECTVAAVVTTPFFARDTSTLNYALEELRELPVKRVLILADCKGSGMRQAQRAYEEQKPKFTERGIGLDLLEVDAFDTAMRWRPGIQEVLKEADAALLVPSDQTDDLTQAQRERQRAACQQAIEAAHQDCFFVGDYRSKDIFKIGFDAALVYPLVDILFGVEMQAKLKGMNVSKLRSEWLLVGRRFFQRYEKIGWSPDPTILLLKFAAEHCPEAFHRFWLSDFGDDSGPRGNPFMLIHQILRCTFALITDRVFYHPANSQAQRERLAACVPFRAELAKAFDLTLRVIDQTLERQERDERHQRLTPVANPKIAGFDDSGNPQWAAFSGYSYILRPHNGDLSPLAPGLPEGLKQVNCQVHAHPHLRLYKAFSEALDEIGMQELKSKYGFCLLPPPSWHITYWDGINVENLGEVWEDYANGIESFLVNLPYSFRPHAHDFLPPTSLELPQTPLRLRFKKLSLWKNSVLVAQLEPDCKDPETVLQTIEAQRRVLDEQWKARFGVQGVSVAYAPHVSQGYFANEDGAMAAERELATWQEVFARACAGVRISFEGASLMVFRNMAEFLTY